MSSKEVKFITHALLAFKGISIHEEASTPSQSLNASCYSEIKRTVIIVLKFIRGLLNITALQPNVIQLAIVSCLILRKGYFSTAIER